MPFQLNLNIFSLCLFLPLIIIAPTSCKKLVDPGTPTNRLSSAMVYSNDSLALQALNGIYTKIMQSSSPLNGYATWLCGAYSDELEQPVIDNKFEPFLTCSLEADNPMVSEIWGSFYKYIYQTNAVIEGINNSGSKLKLRNQLLGEAHFLRALNYFYLVNLFGDVPLVTSTNYKANTNIARTVAEKIYDQMVSDLQKAQQLLSEIYLTNENPFERVRANRFAATALLARVYLYKKDWVAAENAATQVIQSFIYRLETELDQPFLSISKEAILQFLPAPGSNTSEGVTFIPQNGNLPAFSIRDSLLNAFEPGDKRWQWIEKTSYNGIIYYYPLKYKRSVGAPYSENYMVLRLAEQYLIRAESRIMQNDFAGATADINTIRERAGLAAKAGFNSQAAAMVALEQERRTELFAEWGHRWFDLKRWPAYSSSSGMVNRADEVLNQLKPSWQTTALLWPLPAKELGLNNALIQNNGY
jgi:hypothetical protein